MEDNQIMKTANTILSQLTVPRRVTKIDDVNVDMFITLYEGLCGESIPDLILPASSEEAEVHNMQCVIDSLALDILHTSLAHIVGQDVVRGRRMSIMNLLDIFSGLLEYILDGIERDDSSAEVETNKDLDTINQSTLSDAVRRGLTDASNTRERVDTAHTVTSDENTEDLIALGQSPTASPSSKKSRRSGENPERRRSRKATLQAVSQPIASSSMQSLIPSSCTESESDTSAKPSAGRALAFSKVPAEFSPKDLAMKQAAGLDSTFTKPSVPPERTIANKLADEILKTGESTRELIALGDTPVLRPRTRSSTKKAITREETNGDLSQSEDTNSEWENLNASNNARKVKSTKRLRQPKRHVSFVSDRTLNDEDTLADVPTAQLKEPRRVASDPYAGSKLDRQTDEDDRPNLSSRLVDYFDQKEAYGGRGDICKGSHHKIDQPVLTNKPLTQAAGDQKHLPLTDSTEYQTAMEKSASLYDRVTALRNAASEKLESLRSDSACDSFHTAPAGAAADTTEYQEPAAGGAQLSDYAKKLALSRGVSSAVADRHPSAGSQSDNLYKTVREHSEYHTTRQSNVPNLNQDTTRGTTGPAQASSSAADSYATARLPLTECKEYRSTHSQYPLSGGVPEISRQHEKIDTADSGGGYRGDSLPYRSTLFETGYGFGHHVPLTYTRKGTSKASTDKADKLQTVLDGDNETESRSSSGYKRSERIQASARQQPGRKVRFNRSTASTGPDQRKAKSEAMVDAVKKTLDEEKWRERMQQKLLARQYKDDLTDMVEAHQEQLEEEKSVARQQDKEFTANIHRLSEAYGDKPHKTKHVYNPKGFLLPKSRVLKKKPTRRSRVQDSAALDKPSKPLDPGDDDFLPNLMEEFPHLYLAPETIKQMWTKHQQQTSAINKLAEEDKRKRCKAKTTIEDAEKRQALLMNIMQKELDHTKRLKQTRDKENADIETKRKARDVRVQSARVKKYYDDYSTRMKSSMLKNKTKEEQLFKRLFAEGLRVQKERMQGLQSYTREQREKRAQKQQVDVASLENFYKDQFTLLAESVSQERKNVEVRDTAQAKVLDKMKMELRRKMEKDINNFQEQLKRDEDDYYFRQLDAEKVVQQLNMTRYQTGL